MRQKHMMPTSNMSHLVSFSCSFSFWPFCVRICRISTRTSLACEEQQFDGSIEDQDMCGDLAIISRVLCTGHLLVEGANNRCRSIHETGAKHDERIYIICIQI